MVFLKPAQPSLDEHYVSEHDATHTLHGVPVAGGGALAGVSAPSAAAAAPSQQRSAAQAAAAPPARQQQQQQQHQGKAAPAAQGGARGGQQQAVAKAAPAPVAAAAAHGGGGAIAEGEEDLSADLSGQCQFCGLADPSFTEEKLDLHYWSDCPNLICCKQCEQVIEIPTLQEHLLAECEVAGAYRECPRCLQAIPAGQFDAHVEGQSCAPPAPGMARCALCQADVHKSDEGWKQHLLIDTCPKNARPVK
jgi:centrosomal protein CEP104